jgi:hypothetical protein
VELLRANCLTLVERPGVVNAVSVSRGFAYGHEEERDAVIALAQRLAEEYGLAAAIERSGHFLTIRFTRKEPASSSEPRAGASLLAMLRALFRRPKAAAAEQSEAVDAVSPTEVRS